MQTSSKIAFYNQEMSGAAQAVHYHSSYLKAVSTTALIAEGVFKYPVVEFLERSHLAAKDSICLEQPHQLFENRRIDISWNSLNNTPCAPNCFMEMKYVKAATTNSSEIQRFFNDLLRLASLSAISDAHNTCYFLASGLTYNWINAFEGVTTPNKDSCVYQISGNSKHIISPEKSVFSKWLSSNPNKPVKEIKTKSFSANYQRFKEEYKSPTSQDESTEITSFKTELIWISKHNSDLTTPTVTGLWAVYC